MHVWWEFFHSLLDSMTSRLKSLLIRNVKSSWGRRDASVVNSTDCSCLGPGFVSQLLQWHTTSCNSKSRELMPLLAPASTSLDGVNINWLKCLHIHIMYVKTSKYFKNIRASTFHDVLQPSLHLLLSLSLVFTLIVLQSERQYRNFFYLIPVCQLDKS